MLWRRHNRRMRIMREAAFIPSPDVPRTLFLQHSASMSVDLQRLDDREVDLSTGDTTLAIAAADIFPGAAPSLWGYWDANVASVSSGKVTLLPDRLGDSSKDFAQATSGLQAAYSATDSNWNNAPSMTYSASAATRYVSASAASVTKVFHSGSIVGILAVFRATDLSADRTILGTSQGASNTQSGINFRVTSSGAIRPLQIGKGASPFYLSAISPNSTISANQKVVMLADFDPADVTEPVRMWVNGTQIAINPNGPSGTPSTADGQQMRLGAQANAALPFEGQIQALGLSLRRWTTDEVAYMTRYYDLLYDIL